jgi:hypothetical protein
VNARDLRLLDLGVNAPASILSREQCLVVNLQHIKLLITSDCVRHPPFSSIAPSSPLGPPGHAKPKPTWSASFEPSEASIHLQREGCEMGGDGRHGVEQRER